MAIEFAGIAVTPLGGAESISVSLELNYKYNMTINKYLRGRSSFAKMKPTQKISRQYKDLLLMNIYLSEWWCIR